MSKKHCLVLAQHREGSEYNDFIGKYYHFPKKYKKMLSEENLEFVYYEPKKGGKGVYFGYGRLGKVFEDKREDEHYFVEILEYKPFAEEVSFEEDDGTARERGPGYNPRNSVRKVAPKVLDEICLDGEILLNFTADAHLIRVLGEELIASEVVGVLELIKNSYDANANRCRIRIEKIPGILPFEESSEFSDLQGPVIVIEDDGDGMDRQTIENGWLRPASTIKTQVKDRLKAEREAAIERDSYGSYNSLVKELKKHHGGRLPLGEKGVGRFATHRLGTNVIIKTKVPENDYEYILEIDWNRFDDLSGQELQDLSAIGISLKRQSPSRNYGKRNSGTQIIVFGGRKGYELTGDVIKDINRSVLKLKSPQKGPTAFKVVLECPQVPDLEQWTIESKYVPVFSLTALVDDKGCAEGKVIFNPPTSVPLPSQEFVLSDYDLRIMDKNAPLYWKDAEQKTRNAECGAFYLNVNFWYRSTPWIAGPDRKGFTEHLDEYGGISIYRDGLNILPAEWGAEVDWLKLSKRHIKKGLKLSYYNMIDQLEIDQATNIHLVDKTDRQGLINNPAMRDLSVLTRNLIFYVENHFRAKRDEFSALTSGLIREPKKLGDISKEGSYLVDNIIRRYNLAEDVEGILSQYREPGSRKEHLVNLRDSLKSLNNSMDVMQNVQEMLSEQAGYGLAISVAVHEISKMASNYYNGIVGVLRDKKLDRNKILKLKEASGSLKTEIKRLGPIKAIRNESLTKFQISKAVKFCKAVFERHCKDKGIEFVIEKDGDFSVYCRYGAANQIISNLLDNSCYWLDRKVDQNKKIVLRVDGENRQVIIADNGPDVEESIRPYLYEPGYSLRVPPSGLGLYICKYYMSSMNGNIYEAGNKDRIPEMKGAQFVLDFSRVSSEE